MTAEEKNSEYWEQRVANNIWKEYNNLEDRNRSLLDIYEMASKNIREELYSLAEKHSKDGTLSLSDMHRENRLKILESKYIALIEELGDKVEAQAIKNMKQSFEQVYSNVISELITDDFTVPNKKVMEQLLKEPWHGGNFSSRLWGTDDTAGNMQKLLQALNSQVTYGLQTGQTVTQMAVNLNHTMDKGFNAAHTLVRTESMHYMNGAALQSYKDAGIECVEVWCALDERTCGICGKYHGKPYPIAKCPVLPFHANCRCTIIPVTDKKVIEECLAEQSKGDIINAGAAVKRNTNTPVRYSDKYNYDIVIDGWSDDVNNMVSKCARRVAELGTEDGNEHLFLVDVKGASQAYYEKGTMGEVGGEKFWNFLEEHSNQEFIFIHNHNTDGYFSETDMRTLLREKQVNAMVAVRNDAVMYVAEKGETLPKSGYFDPLFEEELNALSKKIGQGLISEADRNIKREEIIVEGLLKQYTKAGKLVEINGQK